MLLTPEQLERLCGFLLLNEFNTFTYCCKSCASEFVSGAELEAHVLEHQDSKTGFENILASPNDVFQSTEPWKNADQQMMTIDEIKQEIEVEPTVLQESQIHNNSKSYENHAGSSTDSVIPRIKRAYRKRKIFLKQQSGPSIPMISKIVPINPPKANQFAAVYSQSNAVINSHAGPNYIVKQLVSNEVKRQKIAVKKVMRYKVLQKPVLKDGFFNNLVNESSNRDPLKMESTETHPSNEPSFGSTADVGSTENVELTANVVNERNFSRKDDVEQLSEVVRTRPCPVCKEQTSSLTNHLKDYHNGAKPYKCPFCVKTFAEECQRTRHMQTHSGEKPYLCSNCGESFKSPKGLFGHIDRIHRAGKPMPYSCAECNLGFPFAHLFEKHHLMVHNEKRPHACEICSSRFKDANSLRIHKSTHNERLLKCRYCEMKFKNTGGRRIHERRSHERLSRESETESE